MTIAVFPHTERSSLLGRIQIERFLNNPLLIPDIKSSWMSTRVFNCGVIKDDGGLYKMLFRATFQRGDIAYTKSNLGLALSSDGVQWRVHDTPVLRSGYNQYCRRGIEDPRIVKWIDGRYYIFTNVVSGFDNLHIGIWKTKNFLEYKWVGVPFPQITTSAAVFPEFIGGNIYLLYRKFPHIWVSKAQYINLHAGWEDRQIVIKNKDLYKSLANGLSPRKVAMASPPIKTPEGWLILVNVAHGKRFAEVYSIGFVVLDLDDPTIVKYIHPNPILWPEKAYEMRDGTRGICYCCAAVESPDGESFYVYWGAADQVIAAGTLRKKDLQGICY